MFCTAEYSVFWLQHLLWNRCDATGTGYAIDEAIWITSLYLNVNGVPLFSVIIQLDLLYLVAVMKNKKSAVHRFSVHL